MIPGPVTNSVTLRLLAYLDETGAPYRLIEHEPATTSEESAKARGEELRNGAKALLLKADGVFHICVMSAARKLDSKAVKKKLGAKDCRFASKEELFELTGLVPGSVPPFGRPVLPFPLLLDRSIAEVDRVAFNAGSLTTSVVIAGADYMRLAEGDLCDVSVAG